MKFGSILKYFTRVKFNAKLLSAAKISIHREGWGTVKWSRHTQNNRNLIKVFCTLHLCSKFGDLSLNSSWVIMWISSWLTYGRTDRHTNAGNDLEAKTDVGWKWKSNNCLQNLDRYVQAKMWRHYDSQTMSECFRQHHITIKACQISSNLVVCSTACSS